MDSTEKQPFFLQKLVREYRDKYASSLYEDIKSETSGHFRTVLKGLVLPEARFLAGEMKDAMVSGVALVFFITFCMIVICS